MPVDTGPLREVAWRELFPWLNLVRAARLALAPRLLVIAALGLLLTAAGWRFFSWVYSGSDDPTLTAWRLEDVRWRWETPVVGPGGAVAPGQSITMAPTAPDAPRVVVEAQTPGAVADVSWLSDSASPFFWLSRPFRRLFDRTAPLVAFSYALVCSLWALAVWALAGGAISRIVALALASEGLLSGIAGLKFSFWKWPQYFLAPLFSLGGVLALGLVVGWFYGLIMRTDLGVLVLGILWPLMLLAALVMAILLVGLLFGWPLMWPTLSVEGTDSFDALSRSYSYTFQRPLHYLFYALVAGVIGALASIVATGVANLVIMLSYWATAWGSGVQRASQIYHDTIGAGDATGIYGAGVSVLAFWQTCVLILGASFVYSYFWSAATAIYFLLRRHVDGTEMDEIWTEPQEETYGLPPLKDEPSGVGGREAGGDVS